MWLRQLSATLVLVSGLAGCGVAVDQRTLQSSAPPAVQTPDPEVVVSEAPVSEAPVSDVPVSETAADDTSTQPETAATTPPAPNQPVPNPPAPNLPGPDTTQPDTTQADTALADTAQPDTTQPDTAATDVASLAPGVATSVATRIDDLLEGAGRADSPVPPSPPPAPTAPTAPPAPPAVDDAAPQAESGIAEDVVGDIIWNLEAANRARPAPPPEPQIPVGPDPSLASDALEAAFAMLARREYALPDDAFVLPPKTAGMTRIALLVPITGPNAALGTELQHGAELALFSVRNPAIELLVFDTHADGPDAAASQAVIARADIIVGPLFSDAVVSARAIASKADIPMLALSNNLQIAGRGSWLLGYVPEQQVDVLLGYALTTGQNRVGIIAEDAPFGRVLAGHAADRLAQFGLRPEDTLTLTSAMLANEDQLKSAIQRFTGYEPPAEGEAAPAFADLPPARFDALLFAGSADFALRTAPVLAYYDADPERVLYLGNAQWNQQRILTEPSLQGGVFASRPTGRDAAFTALWSDVWPSRPGVLARLSFDAMAMATVLTGHQRTLWNAALESESGFSGFSGAYRLLPDGGNRRAFELRRIENGVSSILQPAPDKI